MKLKIAALIPTLIFGLTACGGGRSPDAPPSIEAKIKEGKEVASQGNAEIHEGFLVVLGQVNPNIQGQIKSPAGKKRLVDSLIEQELFFQESMKRGLDKSPNVLEKAALYQRAIISQALLDDEVKKRSKDFYEQNKDKEFSRVKLAHILVRPKPPTPAKPGEKPSKVDPAAMDAEAKKRVDEAKEKLNGGMAWEEAVTLYTDDPVTKTKGGDLGMISRQDRRIARLGWEEIVAQAFTMKVGDISSPIKAKDGYHIIKLEEAASVAPFEEVQASIEFKLRGQIKTELLANLTGGKPIEYNEADLKNIPAAGPGPEAPGAPNQRPVPIKLAPQSNNSPIKTQVTESPKAP